MRISSLPSKTFETTRSSSLTLSEDVTSRGNVMAPFASRSVAGSNGSEVAHTLAPGNTLAFALALDGKSFNHLFEGIPMRVPRRCFQGCICGPQVNMIRSSQCWRSWTSSPCDKNRFLSHDHPRDVLASEYSQGPVAVRSVYTERNSPYDKTVEV